MSRSKVDKYPADQLHDFIVNECAGDLTRLSRRARQRVDQLRYQKTVYLYAADELLIECDSHLRFFLDWMEANELTEQGK